MTCLQRALAGGVVAAVMCIFFGACSIKNESAEKRVFLITDYGAVGDSVTVNTAAIQKSIDECAREGGGTVLVPKGCFSSGAIFLKSEVTLRIESGGKLRGIDGIANYPTLKNTRIAGIEMDWPSAFINAIDVENVTIAGEGTIDGSGYYWWEKYWIKRDSLSKIVVGDLIDWYVPRPRMILIHNATDIRIDDLKLRNSGFWTLHICYSNRIDVDGLDINNPVLPEGKKAASSDGIDIDSSTDVVVRNTTISVDDDCIAIKSGRGSDGLRINRPTENVRIEKCTFLSGHGGVSIGTETAGGIRNVYVRDCKSEGNNAPIKFKPRPGRGGVIENVVHEGWVIKGAGTAIDYSLRQVSGEDYLDEWQKINVPFALATPRYRNITLRNIDATQCKKAMSVLGWPLAHAENIIIDSVSIQSEVAGKIQFIDNLQIRGLNIQAADALVIENVKGFNRE